MFKVCSLWMVSVKNVIFLDAKIAMDLILASNALQVYWLMECAFTQTINRFIIIIINLIKPIVLVPAM